MRRRHALRIKARIERAVIEWEPQGGSHSRVVPHLWLHGMVRVPLLGPHSCLGSLRTLQHHYHTCDACTVASH